jgi:hypothetical protein
VRRPSPGVTSLMPRLEMHWKPGMGRPTLGPSSGLSKRRRYRNALDASKDVGSVALCLFRERFFTHPGATRETLTLYFASLFLLCAQFQAVATI